MGRKTDIPPANRRIALCTSWQQMYSAPYISTSVSSTYRVDGCMLTLAGTKDVAIVTVISGI